LAVTVYLQIRRYRKQKLQRCYFNSG